jgi:hypothetical protein
MTPSITVAYTMMSDVRALSPYRRTLRQLCADSLVVKSIFLHAELAAIFGVEGTTFAQVGTPWLVLAPGIEFSDIFFRYAQELRKLQAMFSVLELFIEATDKKSIHEAKLLGFTVGRNKLIFGDSVFRKAVREA